MFTFVFCSLCVLSSLKLLASVDIEDNKNEQNESVSFLKNLMDKDILAIAFAIVFDMFMKSFYYPTFSNYLIDTYGLNVEISSLFFVINMVSYLFMLQIINPVITTLGPRLTILVGILFNTIGTLFLPPVSILPKSLLTIIVGQLILGIPSASIYIPALCEFMDIYNSKMNMSEDNANSMASTLFILSLNIGESIGPAFGGYVTNQYDFTASCVYASVINTLYAIIFGWLCYEVILKHFEANKRVKDPNAEFFVQNNSRQSSHLVVPGRYYNYSMSVNRE
jgi:MFS family permease